METDVLHQSVGIINVTFMKIALLYMKVSMSLYFVNEMKVTDVKCLLEYQMGNLKCLKYQKSKPSNRYEQFITIMKLER